MIAQSELAFAEVHHRLAARPQLGPVLSNFPRIQGFWLEMEISRA
jgi:hypothetical protein